MWISIYWNPKSPENNSQKTSEKRKTQQLYLASELSNEDSKLCTNEKSNNLTKNTVPSGASAQVLSVQQFLLGRVTLVGRACYAGCMGSNIG